MGVSHLPRRQGAGSAASGRRRFRRPAQNGSTSARSPRWSARSAPSAASSLRRRLVEPGVVHQWRSRRGRGRGVRRRLARRESRRCGAHGSTPIIPDPRNIWGYLWGKLDRWRPALRHRLTNESIADAPWRNRGARCYAFGREVGGVSVAAERGRRGLRRVSEPARLRPAPTRRRSPILRSMVAHNRRRPSRIPASGVIWRSVGGPTEVDADRPGRGASVRQGANATPATAWLIEMYPRDRARHRPLDGANLDRLIARRPADVRRPRPPVREIPRFGALPRRPESGRRVAKSASGVSVLPVHQLASRRRRWGRAVAAAAEAEGVGTG